MAKTFETLRDKLVTKLQAIADIQEVKTEPTAEFAGYPACSVYPSDQESDYQNTVQNERYYNFVIPVFYETASTGVGDALVALYDLVDQIIDAFDQDPTLTGIALPTGKQMISIEPSTSEWQEVPERKLLMTNIKLAIRVSADMQ
jgi:hypothetical protein